MFQFGSKGKDKDKAAAADAKKSDKEAVSVSKRTKADVLANDALQSSRSTPSAAGSTSSSSSTTTDKSIKAQSAPEVSPHAYGSSKKDVDKYHGRCVDTCNSILSLWKKAGKEVDVDNYVSTTELALHLLERVKSGNSIPTFGLVTSTKKLSKLLKEYEKELKSIGDRLASYISSSRKRRGLAQHNARLHAQLRAMVEASGVEMQRSTLTTAETAAGIRSSALPQLVTQRTRARLTAADGFRFWQKYFSDIDMELVPFDNLLGALQKELGVQLDSADVGLLQHILDRDRVGSVSPSDFNNFLKLFGSIAESLPNARTLYSQRWFHDFLTVDEVMRLLADQPVGTFLVRYSRSLPGSFVLDYVPSPGQLKTLIIRSLGSTGVEYVDDDGKAHMFPSISNMISTQKETFKFPLLLDFLNKTWFCGTLNRDEAEKMLSRLPVGTFLVRFADAGKFAFFVSYVVKSELNTTTVRHASVTKVPSGYLLDWTAPIGREEPSSSSARSSTIERSSIYPSITQLISSHPSLWKYNYDPDHVPKIPVADFKESIGERLAELRGPLEVDGQGSEDVFTDCIYAASTATYPRGTEGYNIVCDQYAISPMGNRTVFALADGCGWGRRPREAAIRASKTVLEQVADRTVQVKMTDSIEIRNALLRSFNLAHEQIMQGKEEYWMAGATTLAAGEVIEIDAENGEWALIAVCVGDCKIFVWNSETEAVVDITAGNRLHARNAKDAGGSLGAQKDSALPDLRNLGSYFWPLAEGDIVIAVSDGIYDNVDPECIGLSVQEALAVTSDLPPQVTRHLEAFRPVETLRWDRLENWVVESIKNKYMVWKLGQLLRQASKQAHAPRPQMFAATLIENSKNITQKTRTLMESDPSKPEPADHREYPGKMDHATAIAIMAGPLRSSDKMRTARSGGSILPVRLRSSTVDDPNGGEIEALWMRSGPCESALHSLESDSRLLHPFDISYTRVVNGTTAPTVLTGTKLSAVAAGGSLSTYPSLSQSDDIVHMKLGDPVSTYFVAELTPTRTLTALSSGLHWGKPSAAASLGALLAACGTIASFQSRILSCDDQRKVVLKALDSAHDALAQGTLSEQTVAFALALVAHSKDGSWEIGAASVGYHKIFLLVAKTNEVIDVTAGNAPLIRSDPGGRLGIYKDQQPDLNNIVYKSVPAAEGDILFIMSPGAYWNYDPEILGHTVAEAVASIGLQEDLPNWTSQLKDQWRCERLRQMFCSLSDKGALTARNVVDAILGHAESVTAPTRRYMEANPNSSEPRDFSKSKGKMGHVCCVAVRIGKLSSEEQAATQTTL